MESFGDSNCPSMSDSFSLYKRYMRSFNIVDNFTEENPEIRNSNNCEYENTESQGNVDLTGTVLNKHSEVVEIDFHPLNIPENIDSHILESDLCLKSTSNLTSLAASLENFATGDHSTSTEKSEATLPIFEDSKSNCFKQPVFITSTMENSNNAMDNVPMFHERPLESVFKLPIRELSFNGTIKHVKKLKPIVDPISALTSNLVLGRSEAEYSDSQDKQDIEVEKVIDTSDTSTDASKADGGNESTGDSQYDEVNKQESTNCKPWNPNESSSLEASFDSGVRSPDMFSDGDEEHEAVEEQEPFWNFLKEYEVYDKRRVRKLEEKLRGVLPPPSITTMKTDVTEMLKKYYSNLPSFDANAKPTVINDENSMTPTKRISFVEIPTDTQSHETLQELAHEAIRKHDINDEKSRSTTPKCGENDKSLLMTIQATSSINPDEVDKLTSISMVASRECTRSDMNSSDHDKSLHLKMNSEAEAREMVWPDLLKCRYYDVYYNLTYHSEKFELLSLRYGERYVGAETDTSVNIYSGGLQSPSSASKRKALRLKMAQAKSPGRRLSHLARRRQAFCSAATIGEKAQSSNSKMVLIDKNFFPHRKLINSSERKSPRTRRTPGKKTPNRKTPGKKTPAKTPKSGGSSRKKAMRRLLMDTENITRSQPPREHMIKRALFVSPENRKSVPQAPSSSVPLQAMKSKRALFGSPLRADTKSLDGTQSDHFLKRKRDMLDDTPEMNRSKIAKSLSFGGDSIGNTSGVSFPRRASEMFITKNSTELNENHKKKLLWAVTEALRVHGWRMSSPGFREKASALARLTRKLLFLPPHAARLAAPKLSTSETMLKLARQYVFAIIQGRTVDECFQEEQTKLANEANKKVTGYISASAYQQMTARQPSTSTFTSQIKENFDVTVKQEQPRSTSKNVLQDKLVNIDSNSNSSSGLSMLDKSALFKSNSMPSFEEAAKLRARRQISFDNVDFPKR